MANYDLFKKNIELAEGGYQKLPNDTGNYNSEEVLVGTKFGVSAVVYQKIIGRPPTEEDMKNITLAEAHSIFKHLYWDAIKADFINSQAIAETFADHAINAGTYAATRIMQKVLNKTFAKSLIIDGKVGERTINAINSVNATKLFQAYSQERKIFYNGLNDCKHFCPIWHNRVDHLADNHNVDISKKVKPVSKKKK